MKRTSMLKGAVVAAVAAGLTLASGALAQQKELVVTPCDGGDPVKVEGFREGERLSKDRAQRLADTLMDGWLDQAGRQAHGTVGHDPARLARGRDILEAALAHLAADETVFLHPPGTDAECDAARASLPRNATSSGDSRS